MKRSKWLIALLMVLSLIAAACGGDDDEGAEPSTDTTAAEEEVPQGGELVIGAEQEGDCTDWMGSCGGTSWFYWTITTQTMPFAYQVFENGDGGWEYQPTSVLAGEAELVEQPKQVVTYKINPEAKWSDGTPITSKDFKFTFDQVMAGKEVYDQSGYDKIESVDDSQPDTVVVTFKETYADWKSLFGGNYGIYPAHLIKDHSEIANGYTFSAGPWKLDHWTKGVEWVLVPNESYWGEKPKLDRVTFKLVSDTAAEFQAFKAGEFLGIYPQPQLDVVDAIAAGLPDAKAQYSDQTGNSEALWLHNGKPPFNEVAVRQAIAYSIDRDTVVKRLFEKVGVDKAIQTVTAEILGEFADTDAFSEYTRDLDKVSALMTGAGWKKGTDGIWAKGGQKAAFTMKSTTGNKRRELTEQVVQQQLKEAGFDMSIQNQAAGDLFGDQLPKGDFQAALYANVLTSFYTSNCNLFCKKNIPTEANGFTGNNWTRTDDDELDRLYSLAASSLDEEEAAKANRDGDERLAEIAAILPLDPLPNILLTSTRIVGPVTDNPIQGPFWRLAEWGLRQ